MKTRNIFAAIFAAVALLFSSCSKDIDLTGTSWESTHTVDMTEMITSDPDMAEYADMLLAAVGGKFLIDYSIIIDYTTENAGAITMAVNPSASMNQPAELKPLFDAMTQAETEAMTYTFDGENGTITIDNETENFTYNKSDKTITMTFSDLDPEEAEIMGGNTFTFKQTK